MTKCTLAPKNWQCTREAGHDGPCAAEATGYDEDTTIAHALIEFSKQFEALPEYLTNTYVKDYVEHVNLLRDRYKTLSGLGI